MIKSLIQFFFLKFNYKIINLKKDKSNLDQLLNNLLNPDNTLIFDVGANTGQSIEIFNKLFSSPCIHAFEPDKIAFDELYKKFSKKKNIILNFFALGSKNKFLKFYSYLETGKSSFYKLKANTNFIKYKVKSLGVSQTQYLQATYKKEIRTIDSYCKMNKIKKINFLKIDTQGYEENVLKGSTQMIKNNLIDVIKLELIFSSVYVKSFNIYDVEKLLIPYGYKLFGTSSYGNFKTDQNWQSDFIYVSKHIYKKIKKDLNFKSLN